MKSAGVVYSICILLTLYIIYYYYYRSSGSIKGESSTGLNAPRQSGQRIFFAPKSANCAAQRACRECPQAWRGHNQSNSNHLWIGRTLLFTMSPSGPEEGKPSIGSTQMQHSSAEGSGYDGSADGTGARIAHWGRIGSGTGGRGESFVQ